MSVMYYIDSTIIVKGGYSETCLIQPLHMGQGKVEVASF